MKTIRLWLETHPMVPVFQQLRYEWAEVSLQEVLLKGIHPWQGPHAHDSLWQAFVERLNAAAAKPSGLEARGYCSELSSGSSRFQYRYNSRFERLLAEIGEGILFVDDGFGYDRLLELARQTLARSWSQRIVRDLLCGLALDFNALRLFIKSKAPQVRLSGYADIDKYDLTSLLTVDDFDEKEDLLIRQALPAARFRSTRFLESVADGRGFLCLTPEITAFQLHVRRAPSGELVDPLTYNCKREGEQVRLIPILCRGPGQRQLARQIASLWAGPGESYCFTLHLDKLCHAVEDVAAQVDFSSLSYTTAAEAPVSEARIQGLDVEQYHLGRYITVEDSVETIKEALHVYGLSTSGNKEELTARLSRLCARVYRQHLPVLEGYFATRRLIRSSGRGGRISSAFPVLEDSPLRNMVLIMYLLRHLRGDAIVDATYTDDTYDLTSLARALIDRRVTLEGSFLRVEGVLLLGSQTH